MHQEFQVFFNNLESAKPPFTCPICFKIYKSLLGIKSHLNDHQNKTLLENKHLANTENFDNFVDIDINGSNIRIAINQPILFNKSYQGDILNKLEKKHFVENSVIYPTLNKPHDIPFVVADDYSKPLIRKFSKDTYYRYFEFSQEELDDEIQYDIDDEDLFWLKKYNESRSHMNLDAIYIDTLEWTIDRFEKSWSFKKVFPIMENGEFSVMTQDEDALCCICLDGECHQNNTILFCDLCNLAVHQECYGVPHIPDGPWICRRCLLSPSKSVICCLCPLKNGAFKQTDDGRWAHVICALFVPDVGFSNPVFLEPIDGIERVAPARWKLTCQVCRKRRVGACIQCHRPTCYSAFHATCAQLSGFYLKLEHNTTFNLNKTEGILSPGVCPGSIIAKRSAFCEMHSNILSEDANLQEEPILKKKKDLRIIEGNLGQILSIPFISNTGILEITKMIPWLYNSNSENDKYTFIQHALAYWKLKRKARNGVPLNISPPSRYIKKFNTQIYKILSEELKCCKTLRRDLEKVRLLNELIKKREKLKIESIGIMEEIIFLKLDPLNVHFKRKVANCLEDALNIPKLSTQFTNKFKSIIKMKNIERNVGIVHSSDKISKRSLMRQFLKEKYFEIKSSETNSLSSNLPQFNKKHSDESMFSDDALVVDDYIPLSFYDLVWAKCIGFPWYPAIIINPKSQLMKYQHVDNDAFFPLPSKDVINASKPNHFLVCFFDSKRTWQWLPRRCLDPLGIDSNLDSARLKSINKAGGKDDRKSVIQAYERAIKHSREFTSEKFDASMFNILDK